MTRDLGVIGDLFGTPVGTEDRDPDHPTALEAGEDGGQGATSGPDDSGPPSDPHRATTDRPAPRQPPTAQPRTAAQHHSAGDCVLGLRRGSGPKRRMTIGLPVTVATQMRDGMERLRRHRSLTDFALAAVGSLGDAGDPPAEGDWAPGRYQTALFLAESEREELETLAAARGISVSALVAIAVEPYLEALAV